MLKRLPLHAEYAFLGVLVAVVGAVALLFLGPVESQVFSPPCPTLDLSGSAPTQLRLGVERTAATSCAQRVAVGGRAYTVSGGAWLDDDALVLEEYGEITDVAFDIAFDDAKVYALDGVDPARLLVHPVAQSDQETYPFTFWALWGERPIPKAACRYADDPVEMCSPRAPMQKSVSGG